MGVPLSRTRRLLLVSVLLRPTVETFWRSVPPGVADQVAVPEWPLSFTPAVTVESSAHPDLQSPGIRATRMLDGPIVVLSPQLGSLLVFSATGHFVKSLSRRGEGPGELSGRMLVMSKMGDTIYVVERPPAARRIHTFTVADGFIARTTIDPSGGPPGGVTPLAALGRGSALVSEGGFRATPPIEVGELRADSISLGLVGADASYRRLGRYLSAWRLGYRSPDVPGTVAIATYSLGATLSYAASSSGTIWIGNPEAGTVQTFDADGLPVATVQIPVTPRPYDRSAVIAERDRARRGPPGGDRARREAIYEPDRLPPLAPRFTRLVAGPDGEMWVELFRETPTSNARFLILDSLGRTLAQVTAPPRCRVDDVGRDYVLCVSADDDDVETVKVYRLMR